MLFISSIENSFFDATRIYNCQECLLLNKICLQLTFTNKSGKNLMILRVLLLVMHLVFKVDSKHHHEHYLICFLSSALSLDDEIRVIGNLINSFIRSISFGRDFEQQLSFYVEARASFSNIDAVVVHLVHVSILIYSCSITVEELFRQEWWFTSQPCVPQSLGAKY